MKSNILIPALFVSMLFVQFSYAQKPISLDPEREIIVHFIDNVITHRQAASSGSISDYAISSDKLERSLDSANVEFMGKLIPGFTTENRHVLTREGKEVTLSDWSNTMIIRIPPNGSREKLIQRLEQLPGVAYAEANGLSKNHILKDFTY